LIAKKKHSTSPAKEKGANSLGGFFKRCETHELVKEHKKRTPSVLLELDTEDESVLQLDQPATIGEHDSVCSDISDASETSLGIPELEGTQDEDCNESYKQGASNSELGHEETPGSQDAGHDFEPKRISTGCKRFPDRGGSYSKSKSNDALEKSFVLPGLEDHQNNDRIDANDPTTDWSKPHKIAGDSNKLSPRQRQGPPRKSASFNNYSFSNIDHGITAAAKAARTMRAQSKMGVPVKHHSSYSEVAALHNSCHSAPGTALLQKEVSFTLRRRQPPPKSKSFDDSLSSISRLEVSLSSHGSSPIGGSNSQGNISSQLLNQPKLQRNSSMPCPHSASVDCPSCKKDKRSRVRRCKSGGYPTRVSNLHHSFHFSNDHSNDHSMRTLSASSQGDDIRSRAMALLDLIGPDEEDDETTWPHKPKKQDSTAIEDDLGYGEGCPDSDRAATNHDSVKSSGHDSMQRLSASYGYLSPLPRHRSRSMDLLQASKKRLPQRSKSTESVTGSSSSRDAPKTVTVPRSMDDDDDDGDNNSVSTTCSRSSISSRKRSSSSSLSWGNASFRKNMMGDRKEIDTSSFVTGSRIRRIENVEQLRLGLSVSRQPKV
jgi:hypothetical protein